MTEPAVGGGSLVLDASTIIYIVSPGRSARARACHEWFVDERGRGSRFYIPSVAHFEVLRGAAYAALGGDRRQARALDLLAKDDRVTLLHISNTVLRTAARLWAEARRRGRLPDDERLSGDVVILAEALHLGRLTSGKVIVTENLRHFRQMDRLPATTFDGL